MSLYVTQTLLDLSKSQMYTVASQLGKLIRTLPAQCRRHKRRRFSLWGGRIPWRRKWQPAPVFLPGKSHGRRSLAGYSPWGREESGTTERAHTDTHTHRKG